MWLTQWVSHKNRPISSQILDCNSPAVLKETVVFKKTPTALRCVPVIRCHHTEKRNSKLLTVRVCYQLQCPLKTRRKNQDRGKFVEMGKYGGMLLLIERKQLLKQEIKTITQGTESFPKTREKFRAIEWKEDSGCTTHFLVGQEKFSHPHSYRWAFIQHST